jgi:hypothetical protein
MNLRLKKGSLGFCPSLVYVKFFLVEEVAMGQQVFLLVPQCTSVSVVPPVPTHTVPSTSCQQGNWVKTGNIKKKAMLFRKFGVVGWKNAVTLILEGWKFISLRCLNLTT